jgi:serine/threonine-protein kinase
MGGARRTPARQGVPARRRGVDRGEAGEPKTYVGTAADEQEGALSPDGRLIAYTSTTSGRAEIYVDSFPQPRDVRRVSLEGAIGRAVWRDGRELFFTGADGRSCLACEVAASPALTVGKPRVLFQLPAEMREIVPSPHGDKFLVMVAAGQQRTSLTLVQNWSAQLEKR